MKFVLMFGCNVWVYELKIIKLLMLNFDMLMMYIHVNLCFTHKWCRMNCCWWIVYEIVFDWCCCCYVVLLLMIHTLGVLNFGFVVWIKLLLRVFVKMGWIDEWCWNDIWFHVWGVFESPFEFMNLQTIFGNIFGCWEIKLESFGWKRVGIRKFFYRTDDCSLKRTVSEL